MPFIAGRKYWRYGLAVAVIVSCGSLAFATNDWNFSQCVRNQNCTNCIDSFSQSAWPTCSGDLACLLVKGSTVQATFRTCVDGTSSGQWCQTSGGTTARCNNMTIWFCACRDPKTGDCLSLPSTCVCSGTNSGTGWFTNVATACTGGG